jgi:hypothetical protein
LAVAIIGSIRLIFSGFSDKGKGKLKMELQHLPQQIKQAFYLSIQSEK